MDRRSSNAILNFQLPTFRLLSTVAAIKPDRSAQKTVKKQKNASYVKKNICFKFILISSGGPLLLNGFSQPPGHRLHQLLEVVVIARPATKVSRFFMANAKTLFKVDLRGTLALQSSMATLFSSLEKG
jgi:hypothetical protein